MREAIPMREHMGLYRGKRIDNGEWVEGWLVIKKDPLLEITYCFILAYGKGESYVTWHPVDPDTIGECTGLKDKNGKLIFEGHIVNGNYNEKYVVEYGRHDLSCCGCCHDSHEAVGFYLKDKCGYPHSDDEAWHDLEIIGNITDNPELLKGGEGA
jgi:uncharacterized phage protein (TIGR01671 family)